MSSDTLAVVNEAAVVEAMIVEVVEVIRGTETAMIKYYLLWLQHRHLN